ncbi:MAG: phosphatase PAP2 family protein [Ferruginibacter sp.]
MNIKLLQLLVLMVGCIWNVKAQNTDIDLLKKINKTETNFKNDYLGFCSKSAAPISIGAPVSLYVVGLLKKDKKMQYNGLTMASSFVVSSIVTQGMKRIIAKERPYKTYSFIIKRDDDGGGYAMPSGHTSSAFSTATSLSIAYPKWYVIAPAYIWASSVAWSRMYQGEHYPSDVLVGALVGAGSAWLCEVVRKKIEKKHIPVSKNL